MARPRKNNRLPDFTRAAADAPDPGGRLVWLLVAVALLGGAVLFSAVGYSPASDEPAAANPDVAATDI